MVVVLVPVLVAAIAGSARAETYVSAGLGLVRSKTEVFHETYSELGPGFQAEVGRRLGRTVGIGLHLGIARARYEDFDFRSMFSTSVKSSYLPIDLGVTLHYTPFKRIAFAPWVGFQDQVETETCGSLSWNRPDRPDSSSCRTWNYQSVHQPSMGMTVSVDLSERDHHRSTVFASFTHGIGGEVDNLDITSDSLWIGVGYRYW